MSYQLKKWPSCLSIRSSVASVAEQQLEKIWRPEASQKCMRRKRGNKPEPDHYQVGEVRRATSTRRASCVLSGGSQLLS